MIYDNHKVIIFNLLNSIWPLIPKLQGKTKQRLAILFSCYMTVSHMTVTWHFCGRWVLQKVDINLVLLHAFWVRSSLDLFQMLTILILEYRRPWNVFFKLLTTDDLSMAASDNILREKQYVLYRKILAPSEELVCAYKH